MLAWLNGILSSCWQFGSEYLKVWLEVENSPSLRGDLLTLRELLKCPQGTSDFSSVKLFTRTKVLY